MITVLETHRWPIDEWGLAYLAVRMEEIARRCSLPLMTWNEDGLGAACGCCLRLPSGTVFLLMELAHEISHFKLKGPQVLIDMGDALRQGIDAPLAELLAALGLSPGDVDRRNNPPTAQQVAEVRVWAEKARLARSKANGATSE